MPRPARSVSGRSSSVEDRLARIELWNGDICELEVDAIVNAANLSLWMSTGVGGAIKRAGGDAIEFAAVRQAPVPLGEAIVTPGRQARRPGGHPRRLARPRPPDERDRSSTPPSAARWPGPARWARRASRSRRWAPASAASRSTRRPCVTVKAVRDELPRSPGIEHVIFAMRGAAAYQAFEAALAADGRHASEPPRRRRRRRPA